MEVDIRSNIRMVQALLEEDALGMHFRAHAGIAWDGPLDAQQAQHAQGQPEPPVAHAARGGFADTVQAPFAADEPQVLHCTLVLKVLACGNWGSSYCGPAALLQVRLKGLREAWRTLCRRRLRPVGPGAAPHSCVW